MIIAMGGKYAGRGNDMTHEHVMILNYLFGMFGRSLMFRVFVVKEFTEMPQNKGTPKIPYLRDGGGC